MSTQVSSSPKTRTWYRVDVPDKDSWSEDDSYLCVNCKISVRVNPGYPDIRGCVRCGQTFNILATQNTKHLIKKEKV